MKRKEWRDTEKRSFWNDGGDGLTDSSCSIAARVCFYPLTLTETSERLFAGEKNIPGCLWPNFNLSWRKISQVVKSNICCLQEPSSESERLWSGNNLSTILK